jgi:CRP-like cAMP-binding protein
MPTTMEKVAILQSIAIFARVPPELLVPLVRLAEPRLFAPGAEVVRQGEPGESLFAIVRGKARVLVDGREVALLGPGECFGEMAVLDSEPRSATVAVAEETELIEIHQRDFYAILHERAEIAEEVIRVLSRRVRALLKQLVAARAGS